VNIKQINVGLVDPYKFYGLVSSHNRR